MAQHGIDSAHYVKRADTGYRPVFRCLCGFVTSDAHIEWDDASREFEEHLASLPDGASEVPYQPTVIDRLRAWLRGE